MRIIRCIDGNGHTVHAAEENGKTLLIRGDVFGKYQLTGEPVIVKKLLAPIVPSAILCIGLNYRHHAAESGAKVPEQPVLFVKGNNALQNPGDPILLPRFMRSDEVDYECELAVVIGSACKNVTKDRALDYVLGYMCARNDVSARDWQIKRSGGQWCRGKFFDTFAARTGAW